MKLSEEFKHHLVELYSNQYLETYSFADTKTFLDDALRLFLNDGFGFVENHWHMNVKLVLGALATSVAIVVGLFGWKVPFAEGRQITAVGVFIYFVLYGALMAYMMFVEKGTLYVGALPGSKSSAMARFTTCMKNYNPVYSIKAYVGSKSIEKNFSISNWFDVDGKFCFERFEVDLSSLVRQLD